MTTTATQLGQIEIQQLPNYTTELFGKEHTENPAVSISKSQPELAFNYVDLYNTITHDCLYKKMNVEKYKPKRNNKSKETFKIFSLEEVMRDFSNQIKSLKGKEEQYRKNEITIEEMKNKINEMKQEINKIDGTKNSTKKNKQEIKKMKDTIKQNKAKIDLWQQRKQSYQQRIEHQKRVYNVLLKRKESYCNGHILLLNSAKNVFDQKNDKQQHREEEKREVNEKLVEISKILKGIPTDIDEFDSQKIIDLFIHYRENPITRVQFNEMMRIFDPQYFIDEEIEKETNE